MMLNTLSPTYRLPYGCGTVAIANALTWKGEPFSLEQIKKNLLEHDFVSHSHNMTKALAKQEAQLGFDELSEVDIELCLKALDKHKGVILLSWPDPKNPVGHYTFFYKNRYGQLLENDLLSSPIMFKKMAKIKSPKNGKPAMAWIIH